MTLTQASVQRVKNGHRQCYAETQRAVDSAFEYGGRFAKDHVEKYPEFTPRTGHLQSKTGSRIVKTKGGRILKLQNRAKYASAIDKGASPHVIKPKNGRFLVFPGRDGKLVFARSVNHPGNRPYKFLYRATQATYRVTGRSLNQRLSAIASRF